MCRLGCPGRLLPLLTSQVQLGSQARIQPLLGEGDGHPDSPADLSKPYAAASPQMLRLWVPVTWAKCTSSLIHHRAPGAYCTKPERCQLAPWPCIRSGRGTKGSLLFCGPLFSFSARKEVGEHLTPWSSSVGSEQAVLRLAAAGTHLGTCGMCLSSQLLPGMARYAVLPSLSSCQHLTDSVVFSS